MSSQASLAHCGAQESMKKQVNLPKRGEGKKKKKKARPATSVHVGCWGKREGSRGVGKRGQV